MSPRRIISLLLVLAAAAVLRGALLSQASPRGLVTPDSDDYHWLAVSLRDDGTFTRNGLPEIFRTPGYPVLLMMGDPGPVLATYGELLVGMPTLALVGQILLDVALVGVVYALAVLLLDHRTALLAAALQAITPVAIASSCRLLSDSFYAFVFTTALLLMVGYLRTRRWWALVAAGVALGLAVYVRPVGQVMVFVFAAAALLPWGAAADRLRRRLAAAAVFMCVVAAVTGPWVVRNHVRADYCGFSSFATDSLYTYVGPRILAGSRDVSVRAARSELAEEQRLAAASLAARSRLTVGAMARWRARRARQIIAGNLGTCAMMHARGTVGFVLPGATDVLEVAGVTRGQRGTLAVLQSEGMGAAAMHYFGGSVAALVMAGVMLLVPLAKFCGAAVCLFRRARLRMPAWSWLLLAVVVVSAMLGGPASTPRFRVPVEPVLSVVAAAGLLAIRDAIRFQTTRC